MKLGFVGLGNMGHVMARALLHAGHTIAVWDRTPAKADDLVTEGARLAGSPADAAQEAEVALSSLSGLALAVGGCAVAGVVYAVRVLTHARRQTDYVPALEDWIWHAAFPILGYGTLAVSAGALGSIRRRACSRRRGLLLLLFVGIHNSWDAVTYIALRGRNSS